MNLSPISALQTNQKELFDHWDTSTLTRDEELRYKELCELVLPKAQGLREDYHPFSSSPQEGMTNRRHLQLLQLIDNSITSTTIIRACKGTLLLCTSERVLVSSFSLHSFGTRLGGFLTWPAFQGFWWGGRKLGPGNAILLEGTYPGQGNPTQEVAEIKGVFRIDSELKALCWVLVEQQRLKQSAMEHSEAHECHIYEGIYMRFFPLGGDHFDWRVLSQIQLLTHPNCSRQKLWNTWIWRELAAGGHKRGGNFDRTDSPMSD